MEKCPSDVYKAVPIVTQYETLHPLRVAHDLSLSDMAPVPSGNECSQNEEHMPKVNQGKAIVHFMYDPAPQLLEQPGLVVVISALKNSPFLHANGARQLVSFLDSLQHRSLILIGDSLQRCSIMAMRRKSNRKMNMESARQLALERGDLYVESISKALEEVRTDGVKEKITLVRWDDVMIGNKDEQERIFQRHFLEDEMFRERVEEIANVYLADRTPNSRFYSTRLKHEVNFLLGELGLFVGGIRYQQERYQTVMYASRDTVLSKTKANVLPSLFSLVQDILTNPCYENLKKEVLEADEGAAARNGCPVLVVSGDNS